MVKERKDYGIIYKGFVWLKTRWRRWQKKRQGKKIEKLIKEAERLKELTGYKYLVLLFMGRYRVLPKQMIKTWWKAGMFKQGVTLSMIEKKAIYVTKPKTTKKENNGILNKRRADNTSAKRINCVNNTQ